MNIFFKGYEIQKDAPKPIEWEEYENRSKEEFLSLLDSSGDDERIFQTFFEKNPSYVPGALELFGQSGHYPYMHTLISQPPIGNSFKKIPDFLWLANNSLTFSPVFVEIEKPSKVMYNKNGTLNANFSQAIGQIYEWKAILNKAVNQLSFFDCFNIPQELRQLTFNPQFLLIYGRRYEYENNELLSGKRAALRQHNIEIMSFDRLRPIRDYYQFTSCKVRNKEYWIEHIPATFKYRADCAKELVSINGFKEKIQEIDYISSVRKEFLYARYDYWMDYGNSLRSNDLTISGEGE